MASPLVRTDAEGRIVGITDDEHKSSEFTSYLDAMRAGTISKSLGEIAATPTPIPGELDGTEAADIIEVTLVAGQTYSFDYRGAVGGVVDPYLALFGPGFSYITEDDDGGAGRNSLITHTATTSGTYYLYATSFYTVDGEDPSVDAGAYTINMWSPEADVPGSTNVLASLPTAVEIGLGTTYGNLEVEGDNDYFKIEVSEGMVYTFGYAGGVWGAADRDGELGENLARLTLYDENGVSLGTNFNYESGLSYFAKEDATIYVRAAGSNEPALGGTGGYTLDVAEIDPATRDPLESLNWDSANNVPFVDTDGDGRGDTAYVYFAPAGENFGELADDDVTPMTTYGWTAVQQDAVMSALEKYEQILDVNYEITTDVSQATFRLLTTNSALYGAYFYPQAPVPYGTQQGIGTFNLLSGGFGTRPESLVEGGFSYGVILHEFGHAHGIAHPHDTGGGSEVMLGVAGSASYGVYDLNQGVYTVMSYNDAWDFHPDGPTGNPVTGGIGAVIDHGWSGTLGAFDIAVLQARYGVHAYNEGDNVYALNDDYRTAFYQTIWDSAGNDTIAYDGDLDAQIDLTAATLDYTPTGGGVVSFLYNEPQPDFTTEIKGGYTIANGVVIENATGGSGDDALIGNAAANTLTGNAGNDTLLGRDGADTLRGGDGDDVLNGGAGKNELIGGAGNDTFVFEDTGDLNKIRDFDSGNDMIDLTALGVSRSDVKIAGANVFVDTDGVKGHDLHIVVQGDRVQWSDLLFTPANGSGGGAGQAQVDQMMIV